MNTSQIVSNSNNRQVATWLFVVCAFVFSMIMVGGVTRLTESGLSMVNWQPISGIIPPLTEVEWNAEFEAYKQYPEYQKVNMGMDLDEFKSIFFWEYAHRLLGRLIGVVFAVPFFIFLLKSKIKSSLKPHLWGMMFLGGCQGLLGWWMVKSGLVDRPDVSHYRLTAHLGLAFVIYVYMFWVALRLIAPQSENKLIRRQGLCLLYVILLFIQVLLGGLVAGLNAGLISDTWPLMMGQIIPDGLFYYDPWYMNLFNNPLTLHFQHRTFAYAVGIIGIALWWNYRSDRDKKIVIAVNMVLVTIFLQIILGVLTIINMVPIPLAAAHQAGAVVTLSAGLYLLDRLRS
ncbi:COX15/CtaA family protein [Alphaproteobacteria bacterium]|nr:COX15/CtaA family protein [Alphaproteobacteria bacterium]